MTCGKFAFKSYNKAAQVANRQNRDRRNHSATKHKVQPYWCALCGAHHVTGHNN